MNGYFNHQFLDYDKEIIQEKDNNTSPICTLANFILRDIKTNIDFNYQP